MRIFMQKAIWHVSVHSQISFISMSLCLKSEMKNLPSFMSDKTNRAEAAKETGSQQHWRTEVWLRRYNKVMKATDELPNAELVYYAKLMNTNVTTSAPRSRSIHPWLYNMTHLPSCVQESSYIITTETCRACLSICLSVYRCEVTTRNELHWKSAEEEMVSRRAKQ